MGAPLWKPGQSGNPGGKPKQLPSAGLTKYIRENSRSGLEMAEFYFAVMRGVGFGKGANLTQRMQAAEWLASRGYGKSVEVALSGQLGEGENPLADVSAEDLKRLIGVATAVSDHAQSGPPRASAEPAASDPQSATVGAVTAIATLPVAYDPERRCASCGLRRAHNLDCPERPKPA